MGSKSNIEWTDASWSPIRARNIKTGKVGWYCEHATTGCEFCYAEGMNKRLGTGLPFKPGHRKDVLIFRDDTMLLAPLRWKKPRMIFVCSMTDLFADFVPDDWIDVMMAVMAICPQHTFQVLTKRAERMRAYMTTPDRKRIIAERVMDISNGLARAAGSHTARIKLDHLSACFAGAGPFPNVWLGVSAERQQEADERIPHLLQTPAAVRFISAEPLLGPIDLTAIEAPDKVEGERWTFDALTDGDYYTQHSETMLGEPRRSGGDGPYREHKLDWIIVGGESGAGARPMHPDWARSIRDQCSASGVSYFFKQWGAYAPGVVVSNGWSDDAASMIGKRMNRAPFLLPGPLPNTSVLFDRVGKKRAGRLLDGIEHNAMPERVTA